MNNLTKVFNSFEIQDLEELNQSMNYAFRHLTNADITEITPAVSFGHQIKSFLENKEVQSDQLHQEILDAYQLGLAEAKEDKKFVKQMLVEDIFNGVLLFFNKKSLKATRSLSVGDIHEMCFEQDPNIKKKAIRKAIKRMTKDYKDAFEIKKIKKNLFEFTPVEQKEK